MESNIIIRDMDGNPYTAEPVQQQEKPADEIKLTDVTKSDVTDFSGALVDNILTTTLFGYTIANFIVGGLLVALLLMR